MSKQNKQKTGGKLTRYAAYLYLAMALLIVSVAVASIFALNRSVPELPDYSIPSVSLPSLTELPSDSTEASAPDRIPLLPPKPVYGEQDGVTDNTPSDPPSMTETPSFYRPVAGGTVLKGCALDSLVFSETMKDYRTHAGLDFSAPLGSAVFCYADGVVESVLQDEFYGTTVTVRHERGLVTVYANLAPELPAGIAAGETVKAGCVLGEVGSTARAEAADAPHLHFEMLQNEQHIDPKNELPS